MDNEREFEKFKVDVQKQLEDHRAQLAAHYDHWRMTAEFENRSEVEMFRGVIAFALAALKGVIIVNGAAAIAILALLGSVWSSDAATARDMAVAIKPAMSCFVGGVTGGTLATGLAYLIQVIFIARMNILGQVARVLAVIITAASLAAFGTGAILTVNALAA